MRDRNNLRAMCIHAHFDDFEFTAGGLFSLWKSQLGDGCRLKVVICTDGRAGHHFRGLEETAAMRHAEQLESARLGGYEFEMLRYPDGSAVREACLLVTKPFLAAVWKVIRDFEPDYLFCPPLPMDPLAGVHIDHVSVAEAVRKVAYMINVPHAFFEEFPANPAVSAPVTVPVILNVYDGYMAGNNFWDLAVDVEEAFERIAEMSFCHQSQIMEWLPWVGRHQMEVPAGLEDWKIQLRKRMERQQRELGLSTDRAREVFTVTAWGEIPRLERIREDFPNIDMNTPNWDLLGSKLARYKQE